jgi:hypothetical protein
MVPKPVAEAIFSSTDMVNEEATNEGALFTSVIKTRINAVDVCGTGALFVTDTVNEYTCVLK